MSPTSPAGSPGSSGGAWAPLRRPLFRALWLATLVSGIGSWMHEVGAGWLMITLGAGPVQVALVQAATALPVFLLALPAGALADILDRRRFLIAAQAWTALVAVTLAGLTWAGLVDARTLLLLAFFLACGTAMMTPAWAATLPELVPRDELQAAIALNSTGINVARAIGPAVAGVIVATAGPAPVFALNAASCVCVIVVLVRWRREPAVTALRGERFLGAMRAGVRYVRETPALQRVMVRATGFFLFASSLWALLPLVARDLPGGGSTTYGLLLACLGAGAVGGAVVLPRLRRRFSREVVVRAATLLFALAAAAVAAAPALAWAVPPMLAAGLAWIAALSSFHLAAQNAVAGWVKARALAVYLVTFAAGMAAGSALWGALAARFGVPAALAIGAAGAVAALLALWRVGVGTDEPASAMAPASWPAPVVSGDIEPGRGPVLITVDYEVDPADADAFRHAMDRLARVRRRDGAMSWGLFEDAAQPGAFRETFVVESWAEHERQHHRATQSDLALVAAARAFHRGSSPPRVGHFIGS
jgi:MFS family permease